MLCRQRCFLLNMAVHKWRCLSFCGKIAGPSPAIKASFHWQKCRSMWYFAGRTGLPDTQGKNLQSGNRESFMFALWQIYSEFFLGNQPTRQVRCARLAGWNTANRKHENKSCSRILRSRLKIYSYKLVDKQVHFLVLFFDQKSSLVEFVAKWTVYWSRNKESSPRFEVVMGVKQTGWH